MKKRILCVVLSVLITVSVITLPAQAAAKPAFQWLVDFTKHEGDYDASSKIYSYSWYMDDSQFEIIELAYDAGENAIYCFKFLKPYPEEYTVLELTPNLDAPYSLYHFGGNEYAAEYSVYPGSYTEAKKLHFSEYYGNSSNQEYTDQCVNEDLPYILESVSNLMILSGSNYRLKDLGFAKFSRHFLHVDSDPELVNEFHCGGNTYYRRTCLICGKSRVYDQWEDHIKGSIAWEKAPTCTEDGYGQYLCARCGQRIPDSIARGKALGHDWELTSLDEPINDETHVQGQFRCKRCGEEKTGEYCAADFFKDMPARGNWAHTPIDWAFANGITAGTSATAFSPGKGCTRGQVVTFLWRAARCPEPENGNTSFTDVKHGAFYEKAVAWAVENGIAKGISETAFDPDATCTRGQIVTFLWRFKGTPAPVKAEGAFSDLKPKAFYLDAVAWAVENGVTNGMTETTFCPDNICTRAQIVTFLYRAMQLPEPVEPEPALTEVNAMLIRGPSKNGNDTLPTQTVTVSSAKELQDFLESCYDINYVIGLAADKYSDAYFVNNVLLLTPIRVCGSSPGFTITSVTEKEDQIEVELAKPGDPESPDMCAWVLLIEAAKSMPEREIVIHTTYGERPEYEFTASDTVELMSWINAEIAEPSEKWKYFEDFMNEVKKNNSILIAQPATEAFSLQEILVGSFGTTLSIRFQRSDREDDRIAIDISLSDDTLEDWMERVTKSFTKYYEDWTYEKTTSKVNGVDTEIYFWSGDFTIKGSDHKDHFPPTAFFSYMDHVVSVQGLDGLSRAEWDNAWLEQFTFSTVELT